MLSRLAVLLSTVFCMVLPLLRHTSQYLPLLCSGSPMFRLTHRLWYDSILDRTLLRNAKYCFDAESTYILPLALLLSSVGEGLFAATTLAHPVFLNICLPIYPSHPIHPLLFFVGQANQDPIPMMMLPNMTRM